MHNEVQLAELETQLEPKFLSDIESCKETITRKIKASTPLKFKLSASSPKWPYTPINQPHFMILLSKQEIQSTCTIAYSNPEIHMSTGTTYSQHSMAIDARDDAYAAMASASAKVSHA